MRRTAYPVEYVGVPEAAVIPTLLNLPWWGWLAGAGGAIGPKGVGVDGMSLDQAGYGGSSTPAWETALFPSEPYLHIGGSATAVVGAARTGIRTPATGTNGSVRFDMDLTMDMFVGTPAPGLPFDAWRYWFGVFGQSATLGNALDTIALPLVAFRCSPGSAGDPGWMAVTSDGVTQNETYTGVPVTSAVSQQAHLTIRIRGNAVIFQVNEANDVQMTADLPAAGAPLWPHMIAVKDVTGVGQIRTFYTSRIVMRLGEATKFR